LNVIENSSKNGGQADPYFSIITCTFNSDKYLNETIDSVEAQYFESFEHIFIDAFSTDDSVPLIKAYLARSPERVSLYQIPAKGVANAMNHGVSMARGKVILHLHGDDQIANNRVLGIVRDYFIKSNSSVVTGNCMLTQGSSIWHTWPNKPFKRLLLKLLFLPLMFYSNLVPHPSTYITKSAFQKHGGFDERLKVVMDYDFWFRILKTESIYLVNDIFSVYRFHSQTVSTKYCKIGLQEIVQVRNKYKHDFKFSYAFFVVLIRPILLLRRFLKKTKGLVSFHND